MLGEKNTFQKCSMKYLKYEIDEIADSEDFYPLNHVCNIWGAVSSDGDTLVSGWTLSGRGRAQQPGARVMIPLVWRGQTTCSLAFATLPFWDTGLGLLISRESPPPRRAQMSGEPDPISGWSDAVYFHKPEVLVHLETWPWDSSLALLVWGK